MLIVKYDDIVSGFTCHICGALIINGVCLSCNHKQCSEREVYVPKPSYEELEKEIQRLRSIIMLVPKHAYPNLEELDWTIRNDKSVNDVQADKFTVTKWSGGMTTSIDGPPWAGALARTPDLPLIPGATQFTLTYQMMLTGATLALGQCKEFDIMISGPDGNVANGSCQLNIAEGWMWQVITVKNGNYEWADTGIKTVLAPHIWHSVAVKFSVDWNAKTVTCVSITVNNVAHPVNLGSVVLQPLAWGPNVIVVQRQVDINAVGGILSVDDTQITLIQE